MNISYEPLINRRKEVNKLYEKDNQKKYLMEMDCIDNLFECNGFKTYEKIADVCIKSGFKRVWDIGCAFGHQNIIFDNVGIDYCGINDDLHDFYNVDKHTFIVEHYPIKINAKKDDVAISVLCLGWNCYLYEKYRTLYQQMKTLSRDFNNAILYVPEELFLDEFFKKVEVLQKDELSKLVLVGDQK